ncbi:aminotransferase class III-fold pyridoxal phosphate-dependent enzyme [Rhodococcus sp. IEGM 1354]|uniref:aminotransferase family protein n=1 Tax=Rhodococcus sp. IEGM 1354 TaxID=3047088 RepID=UPI0024B857B7|nr:aminotransferase class III-fold pyridoxal phosphate-dependent enzyme [Rhodococcus sp. IEGM 1354]MDI9929666.1 aminotransferase class III-fold pyridoxal phosphate-dependent enzyme [Rhodococcus sp. IEGM 1354]
MQATSPSLAGVDHANGVGAATGITAAPTQLIGFDRQHVMHGFTNFDRDAAPGPIFQSGKGVRLIDVEGNEWLDGCAGQANVSLGYGRDELADVAAATLKSLAFGTHFYHNRSHVWASQLADRLAHITPAGIDQFFYGVGGSDAVETAIKIARFTNITNGRPEKIHIIGRMNSYHGVSYGGASMTGDHAMWNNIGPLLSGFSHIAQPENGSVGAAKALEDEILRVGPEKVAAFLAEPISTPNGLYCPPDDYWPQIRAICDKYNILMIADEVLVGFGRAGAQFAIDRWNVTPDILTMSKAITAGYLPLSVVGVAGHVREALAASGEKFVHGVTYGGHPAACAVALATIDIMENEDVVGQAVRGGNYFAQQLAKLADSQDILDKSSARATGMMVAINLKLDEYGDEFGVRVHEEFARRRVLVRSYRNNRTIGFLPALTIQTEDIDAIVERVGDSIVATRAALGV